MPRRSRSNRIPLLEFSEMLFPARPLELIKRTHRFARRQFKLPNRRGLAKASNAFYIRWLVKESMLQNANTQAMKYSGSSLMWQKPYARPRPRAAIAKASVWYTAYPMSMVTKPGSSLLSAFADEALWGCFTQIGIKGIHTGPMKHAGGLNGWNFSPSTDGHFDRISNKIDGAFGTEAEFRRMCDVAAEHGGIVIDDIVPGHTGKGADFRLAEMAYKDYPGIYHMIEVPKEDWDCLPDVPSGKDSINIDADIEETLKRKGHIIGKLHRVIFYEPGVKETNWSVTRPVRGVDGVMRRWVYLHYFKDGQPSINWLDPSFAGMRLVIGDALHSISELGTSALRLDANGFLGIERGVDESPAWSEGHPLSEAANHIIASMIRKLGGFTFQELNLSIDDIKALSVDGADLSYDFITRPAYHHALATGDTEFLRLMMRESLSMGIDPVSLVHAMQNHDELTFELVHFWTIHKDDDYTYHDQVLKGSELREIIRNDLRSALTGTTTYNLPFTENGIACTAASSIAAILGIKDLENLSDHHIERIKQLHLLLCAYNALQPGVFALSGWDLTGALTLPAESVADLIKDGDTRWINRGAYDLLDVNPEAKTSSYGMPLARSLYGALPAQLTDTSSFASRLKALLDMREKYGLATAEQLDIPAVKNPGLLLMLHKLPNNDIQLTAINFSQHKIIENVALPHGLSGFNAMDMLRDEPIGTVDGYCSLELKLSGYSFTSLVFKPAA